jgi:hypothetical protein
MELSWISSPLAHWIGHSDRPDVVKIINIICPLQE